MNLSTTQDVATLFKVRPKVVYRWRSDPHCPLRGFKAGNTRFFTEDEIRAFVDWRRSKETAS
jgi:hypothetical protein